MKKPAILAGFFVLLCGLEPQLLAPEANALSTELQERDADFTINRTCELSYCPQVFGL